MIRDLIERTTGYPGLFLLCVFSGTLVPLPEDIALMYAGIHVRSGNFLWWWVLPITFAGILTRDTLAFLAGRHAGAWLMDRSWGRRVFGGDKRIEQARGLIERRGDRAVLIGRFVIGFRAPIFMMSGAMGLSVRQFILWDGIGLCVAIPVALTLGFWFGQPVVDGLQWVLDHARIPLLIILAIAGVWWFRASKPSETN